MAATMLQPKAEPETLIMTVYPSIGALGLGRVIGGLMNLIPMPFTRTLKLSAIVFGLPLAPLGLLLYFWMKAFGERYVLTNHSLQIWSSIGQRLIRAVSLNQIGEVSVNQKSGQEYFHAADLVLRDAGGNEVLTLAGVPRADVFRQTILKARDANTQVAAALATIGARSGG